MKTARAPDRSRESELASRVQALIRQGELPAARSTFGSLVELHQRRATRIAWLYLRDAADAEEAVQDAFVRTYQHIDSYRLETSFSTWFTQILINGCRDRLKTRARRQRWLLPWPAMADERGLFRAIDRQGPEAHYLARERRQTLAKALARLPQRQREVFVLSHYEGLRSQEIGELMGVAEATVRVHLFRAIRKLRPALEHLRESR